MGTGGRGLRRSQPVHDWLWNSSLQLVVFVTAPELTATGIRRVQQAWTDSRGHGATGTALDRWHPVIRGAAFSPVPKESQRKGMECKVASRASFNNLCVASLGTWPQGQKTGTRRGHSHLTVSSGNLDTKSY